MSILDYCMSNNLLKSYGLWNEAARNEYRGFYLATGIMQRRDVSILYSVLLTSSHNIIMKLTSCYNNSISRPGLWAGHETE